MDAYGHVNNVIYLQYLEEARVDMFAIHALRSGIDRLARGVVVARHEIDYKLPIVFRTEPILIETWVERLGHAAFTLGYEVVDDLSGERRVCARAASVMVPYDIKERRPTRLTADERSALEQFLEPAPT